MAGEWIVWTGAVGDRQPGPQEAVEVMFRSGEFMRGKAIDVVWSISGEQDDVTMYRMLDERAEEWIDWTGNEKQPAPGLAIDIEFKNGAVLLGTFAEKVDWNVTGSQGDVVKFRFDPFSNRAPTEPEPAPKANDLPAAWHLVMKDMLDRDRFGREKYGVPLQPHNGRKSLVDAYQEALDLCVYLRTEIYERYGK